MLCLPAIGWTASLAIKEISFERNCGGYLTRAANANTVAIAKDELKKALHYLQENNMTSGYTSIVYNTPDEDVGFWFRNLEASYQELQELSKNPNLSSLEQSNTLLKLRDTLCDHKEGHENLTKPSGIARFPNNTGFMFFGLFSLTLVILASLIVLHESER